MDGLFWAYNSENPMLAALDSLTKLINSPPGVLVAGAVLAGIVWKFFQRVETVLNDRTKKAIARWLRVKNFETGLLAEKAISWPDTFRALLDTVFGKRYFTLKCFIFSCVASYATLTISILVLWSTRRLGGFTVTFPDAREVRHSGIELAAAYSLVLNVVPDYFSVLITRKIIDFAVKSSSTLRLLGLLLLDLYLTAIIATFAANIGHYATLYTNADLPIRSFATLALYSLPVAFESPGPPRFGNWWYYPAFFTSIWLWLYAASGFC